ncbi:MAG: hypothetical protein JWN73_4418, partial [Betaproteobacteria bacterium]|nr:hypothetical protein [Betaproteobacteria bacterium]
MSQDADTPQGTGAAGSGAAPAGGTSPQPIGASTAPNSSFAPLEPWAAGGAVPPETAPDFIAAPLAAPRPP